MSHVIRVCNVIRHIMCVLYETYEYVCVHDVCLGVLRIAKDISILIVPHSASPPTRLPRTREGRRKAKRPLNSNATDSQQGT